MLSCQVLFILRDCLKSKMFFSFLILTERSTTDSLHIGPSQVSGSRVASENQATRAKCETSNSCGEFHAKEWIIISLYVHLELLES